MPRKTVETVKAQAKCRNNMPFVFIFVLGGVVGSAVTLVVQRALRDSEAAQKVRIAREEAATAKPRKRG